MRSGIVDIYTEFTDSNMDKRYPLVDTPEDANSHTGLQIPESFMVDLKLCIGVMDNPGSAEHKIRNNTYISNIKVYPDYVYVSITATIGNRTLVIAESDPIPTSLNAGDTIDDRTIHINPVNDIPVNGTLVVGTCRDIAKFPGQWDIPKGYGDIFPANIIIMPNSINYLQVGDAKLSGDIVIEAGDNVELSYDDATNTIRVGIRAPEDSIVTMDDLISAISDKYGDPIITINGLSPINGEITIVPSDCLTVETSPASSTLTLYNPCGNTCASESFMDDTYTRISDLNKNVSVISSFYASAANTLAQMGVRVASVLEKRDQ